MRGSEKAATQTRSTHGRSSQLGDEGIDDLVVLGVDVEAGVGELLEQVDQAGDRLPPADPGLPDLRPGQVGDPTLPIGDPVERVVVEGQHHPVAGHVHVGLEVAVAEGPRGPERGQRVLGTLEGAAAVGERQRPCLVEEPGAGRHGANRRLSPCRADPTTRRGPTRSGGPAADRPDTRVLVAAVLGAIAGTLPAFLIGAVAPQAGPDLGFDEQGLGVLVAVPFGVAALTLGRSSVGWPSDSARTRTLRLTCGAAAVGMLAVSRAPTLRRPGRLPRVRRVRERPRPTGRQPLRGPQRRPPTPGCGLRPEAVGHPGGHHAGGPRRSPTISLTVGWRWAFVAGAVLAVLGALPGPGRRHRPGCRSPVAGHRMRRAPGRMPPSARSWCSRWAWPSASAAAGALGAFLVSVAVGRGDRRRAGRPAPHRRVDRRHRRADRRGRARRSAGERAPAGRGLHAGGRGDRLRPLRPRPARRPRGWPPPSPSAWGGPGPGSSTSPSCATTRARPQPPPASPRRAPTPGPWPVRWSSAPWWRARPTRSAWLVAASWFLVSAATMLAWASAAARQPHPARSQRPWPAPPVTGGRYAAAVDVDEASERFGALLERPEPEIPLDEASLLIAAHAYPDLDVDAELQRLDRLAEGCRTPTLDALVRYLFVEERFGGDHDDYYDPRNSYLNDVVDRRVGIPISLVGAHARGGTTPRRAARRRGHARPLPAPRPGRSRVCSSTRSAGARSSTSGAARRPSEPSTGPMPPSTRPTSSRSARTPSSPGCSAT